MIKHCGVFGNSMLVTFLFVCSTLVAHAAGCSDALRERDFNFGWKFQLQENPEITKNIPLKDSSWRDVRLPHDWSVEASFSEDLEGCTGYLPGGVAWYQKSFKIPEDLEEKKVYIVFDGVCSNAKFWLNGEHLGANPYGYSPVYFDLTKLLKADGSENVISVHVDHSRYADSRWYTGSGIYRNVKLVVVDKLHIPVWGTFVTTQEISNGEAIVNVETKVLNSRDANAKFTLSTEVYDADGRGVASIGKAVNVGSGEDVVVDQSLVVPSPRLWDIDTPNMYSVVTRIIEDGTVVDEYTTPFGIRSIRHDKDEGFFLNGKSTFVKGVCLHHDAGLVGVAVPEGVWRRRLEKLKAAGVNAIRTSHNPVSEEFLDLCDEMGFLVQNEIFDEMDNPKDKRYNKNEERSKDYITRGYHEHFQEWGESDLKRTILRDRNHPSVFEWSIGNEIEWTYEHYQHVSGLWDTDVKVGYWNAIPQLTAEEMKARYQALPDRKYKLAETAKRLAAWVKELDTTRPVTANLIIPVASLASGYAGALDVVGFSYQIAQYDWAKKNYPDMMFTGNENSGYLTEWNSIIENPMVYSMYMWTGIDYMGEATEKWPQKGWDGDMLDFAGFEKPGYDFFKSIWVNKPHLSFVTRPVEGSDFEVDELSGKPVYTGKKTLVWKNFSGNQHWNYDPGETVLVEVCSNLHMVELILNGRSLGYRSLADAPDRILRWAVPFEEGTLVAKAGFDGAETEIKLTTASEPVAIRLTTDKTELDADGYDVAHVIAQLVDEDGNEVKTSEVTLDFEVVGDVKVFGVDNGSNKSVQDYQSTTLTTSQGRGMLLLQSYRGKSSGIVVSASSTRFTSNNVRIEAE